MSDKKSIQKSPPPGGNRTHEPTDKALQQDSSRSKIGGSRKPEPKVKPPIVN